MCSIMDEIDKATKDSNKPTDNAESEKLFAGSSATEEQSGQKSPDWDEQRAKTWHEMQPPSRPSYSELEIYRRYFKAIKNKNRSAKVLVLGSTVEFRKLAAEEGLNVTVVDYSESYYKSISEAELPKDYDLEKEISKHCDWCEMGENLPAASFDVIIGDLAIGNVEPERLEKLFENISKLLVDGGYLLGKSIYIYSDYDIDAEQIRQKLEATADNDEITRTNIYRYIMYPLSVYAQDEEIKGQAYKIDFAYLYKTVNDFTQNLSEEKKEKFSIWLNQTTKFDEKMPKAFYIYNYVYLLELLNKSGMYIDEIGYGSDEYKNDFPLLILKKGEIVEPPAVKDVSSFLRTDVSDEIKNVWSRSISAHYFLVEMNAGKKEELVEESLDLIKKLMGGAKIVIGKELNYSLAEFSDKDYNLSAETQLLVKGTELDDEPELKEKMPLNYICGLLLSIIKFCKDERKLDAPLRKLIMYTLFDEDNRAYSGYWKPKRSLWLTARICISLFPQYVEWKNKCRQSADKLSVKETQYMRALEAVVKTLADTDTSEKNLFWESETGSHFDTSALCIETLNLYKPYIDGKKLETKIEAILSRYVRGNHIKETFIKYPIDGFLINQVCAQEKINGTFAYKKMCGRIEWYTILYNICQEWGKEKKDGDLKEAGKYIARKLKWFWVEFVKNKDTIIELTINNEKSIIPQILYCLHRTGLFGE